MRLCVVGAGAIGGFLAVRLAAVYESVSVVIRGANLKAVRAHGMKLVNADGTEQVAHLTATDRMAELGVQDVVLLTLKAHQLGPAVQELTTLIGPQTLVVTAQNGIPWWYFFKQGGPYEGRRIEAVDPGGVISAALPIDRTIGCIVYPAAELEAPGVVRVIEGNRFPLGELDGADTERVRALAQRFRDAGFKTPILSDIRSEIWLKLWGNVSFNPISALTHATLEDICRFPQTRELAAEMMREAQAIGEKLGVPFKVSLERRIAGAEAVGAHKTSMLQDVETGRALELDALVKSVIELGRITSTPTPAIEHVYALAALLARTLAEHKARLSLMTV
ncbi:MAG TPA: 2-dehydropantoate 2-reductase [Burkholderiaceae bacterium]|nr:2-dehydropantoate 2-reductase [Burkholderiaceae bacterium]